jgi:hypothetical protein
MKSKDVVLKTFRPQSFNDVNESASERNARLRMQHGRNMDSNRRFEK